MRLKLSTLLALVLLLGACSEKIGSDEWCEGMKEKPKGEWTINEAKDYTKYCVFNQKPKDE